MNRRDFLKIAGLAIGAMAVPKIALKEDELDVCKFGPNPEVTDVLTEDDIINCYHVLTSRSIPNHLIKDVWYN